MVEKYEQSTLDTNNYNHLSLQLKLACSKRDHKIVLYPNDMCRYRSTEPQLG